MATNLPSPGQEQELDEEAERLRTALGAWARQQKFDPRPGNVEECVDREQTAPFIWKIGLQKEVLERKELYMALLRVTGSQSHRLIIPDFAYVVSLEELQPAERGKIICKVKFADLIPGDWVVVYPHKEG
jgi:hypothetical protein